MTNTKKNLFDLSQSQKQALLESAMEVNENEKLTHDQVFFRFKNTIVRSIINLQFKNVKLESDLRKDLGAKDFDIEDVVASVNQIFYIEISENAKSIVTVKQLVEIICDKLKEQERFNEKKPPKGGFWGIIASMTDKKIKNMIAEKLDIDIENIFPDAKLIGYVVADKLGRVEFVELIKDLFNHEFEINDAEIQKIITVQDLIDLVIEKLK